MPRGLPASYIKKAKRELGKGASWHDVFKRAWQLYKGSKVYKAVKGNPRKKSSNPKKGKRRGVSVPKKKRRSRRTKKIPLLPIIGTFAPFAMPSGGYGVPYKQIMRGDFENAAKGLLKLYTGFDVENGTWNIMDAKGLASVLVGAVGHKIASWLGVNRVFGRMPSPLNKLSL